MLKVVFVGSEVHPFAKTGGLADVLGSLPSALVEEGIDVSVIMPLYKAGSIFGHKITPLSLTAKASIAGKTEEFAIWMGRSMGVPIYLIENDAYFSREGLYGNERGDYPDNGERFAFFSMGALISMKEIGIHPDVIHLHDWQTAVLPTYLDKLRRDFPNTRTLYTIHNLAYQGIFDKPLKEKLDLPQQVEFNGKINFMKLGILSADMVSTVSERFKEEIQTEQFGFGLHHILRKRKKDLYGVLNGLDYIRWNPSKDKEIYQNYDIESIELRERNKIALEKELGLEYDELPLIGMVSRLDHQKGFDLIESGLKDILELDLKFVVLGSGNRRYQRVLEEGMKICSKRMKAIFEFNPSLARKIYAGSDLFLMPSYFEPCGLANLIALRYGTPPIVHRTGGLAETIKDFDHNKMVGNGFVFDRYTKEELIEAVRKAIEVYEDKGIWRQLQEIGMKERFTWNLSAEKYKKLYQLLLESANAVPTE